MTTKDMYWLFEAFADHTLHSRSLLEQIDDVGLPGLVSPNEVLADIALELAVVVAVGTLETRLKTAFVFQMPHQVPLPVKGATTVIIRAGEPDLLDLIAGKRYAEGFKRPINAWKQKNRQGVQSVLAQNRTFFGQTRRRRNCFSSRNLPHESKCAQTDKRRMLKRKM